MRNTHRIRSAAALVTTAVAVAGVVLPGSSTAASAGTPTRSSLTGTWSGSYGGTYHGTFTLHWKQTKSTLKGSIKLSSTGGGAVPVTGTLRGSSIRFGTVGTQAITYTGSVSGTSMSGSYRTPGGNGSWSAHKA